MFCFNNDIVHSKNKTVVEDKPAETTEVKENKTDQAAFKAALLAPVSFQHKPDNKIYCYL